MLWEDFLDYLHLGENTHRAFIPAIETERELGPMLVAFCNLPEGGSLFIGIDNVNYHLLGTQIDKRWIESLIQNFCTPIFHVEVDSIFRNDKQILHIQIHEGRHKPYTFLRKCYLRTDTTFRIASLEEEQQLQEQALLKPVADEEEAIINEIYETDHQIDAIPQNTLIELAPQPLIEPQSEIKTETTPDFDIEEALSLEDEVIPEHSELSSRQKQILEYLKSHPSIKNKEYRTLFGVSHKTAHIELIHLVNLGQLCSQGNGRSTSYVLQQQRLQF